MGVVVGGGGGGCWVGAVQGGGGDALETGWAGVSQTSRAAVLAELPD